MIQSGPFMEMSRFPYFIFLVVMIGIVAFVLIKYTEK